MVVLAANCALASVELTSARIYKKQGEIAKSIEYYDLAVAKEPDNIDALAERGQLLGQIAMDAAHTGLRKKIAGDAANPQRFVLERMMGDFDAVRAKGDEKKVKKLAKDFDKQVQEYWWEFYSEAVAQDTTYKGMQARDSMENAEAVLSKGLESAEVAMALQPNDWSSHFVYSELLGFKGKDEAYVNAWTHALDVLQNSTLRTEKPEEYKSNLRYGRLQLIQNAYATENHSETLRIADEMLAEEPGNVEAVQYKAFTLATMASDEKRAATEQDSLKRVALEALANARTSNPEDENIIYYIGQFNLQLTDTTAALAAFDEFLSKAPSDHDVLFMMGLIYLEGKKFGNLEKAADQFRKLTEAYPDDKASWTNYGIALLRLGRNAEGKAAMEKGQ